MHDGSDHVIVSSSHDFSPGLPDSDPDPGRAGPENPRRKFFAGSRSRAVVRTARIVANLTTGT